MRERSSVSDKRYSRSCISTKLETASAACHLDLFDREVAIFLQALQEVQERALASQECASSGVQHDTVRTLVSIVVLEDDHALLLFRELRHALSGRRTFDSRAF